MTGEGLVLGFVEEFGLDAGLTGGDFDDVFVDLFEGFVGGVVMVDGGAEGVAEFLHVGFEAGEVVAELDDAGLDGDGFFFDLEAAEALADGLKVGHEGGGRDDDDFAVTKGVFDEITLAGTGGADAAHEDVVEEGFGWDEHEGEIHGFFGWPYIFTGFVDAGFEVAF